MGEDKIKKEDQHNVVYKMECNSWHLNYIGETQRALATKTKEHKENLGQDPRRYNVISKHRLNNNHKMKSDKVKILDVEPHYYKKKYSEMLQIKSTKNTLNGLKKRSSEAFLKQIKNCRNKKKSVEFLYFWITILGILNKNIRYQWF